MATNALLQIIRDGGPAFMVPMTGLSILSCAVIMERIITYAQKTSLPAGKTARIVTLARSPERSLGTLAAVVEKDRTLAGRILGDALEGACNWTHFVKNVEKRANDHIDALTAHLWILRSIGHLAPLIGLLGTVVGLSISFSKISENGLSQQSVAGGISMALITTIAGLCIALPTLAAEYCLRAWAGTHFRRLTRFFAAITEEPGASS